MKKDEKLLIWITKKQKRFIKMRASHMGITLSDWGRDAFNDKINKERDLGWPDYDKE